MSLVAYGSSGESDEEQENEVSSEVASESESPKENEEQSCTPSSTPVKEPEDEEEVNIKTQNETTLFSSLPPPKTFTALPLEVEADTITTSDLTKNKKTVKISIPSLSEFSDDDSEPATKKVKPSAKGSGLFALLPAPRNVYMKNLNSNKDSKPQAPLVPRVISKPPVKPPPVLPLKPVVIVPADDSTDDPGHIEPQDFFSLGSLNEVPTVPAVDLAELASGSGFDAASEACHSSAVPTEQLVESSNSGSPPPDSSVSVENGDMPLSEEALQALCGRRATRRPQEVEVIDVDGALLLPDPKEWLIKQLTEERQIRSHGHRRHDGPTSQQRRKHQITYLAFQAKENELELKNQWSQNRMSRKQTQSKYGF